MPAIPKKGKGISIETDQQSLHIRSENRPKNPETRQNVHHWSVTSTSIKTNAQLLVT